MREKFPGKKRFGFLLNKGASTVELLLAFVIFTLILAAIVLVSYGNQNAIWTAENSLILLYKAKAGLSEKIADDFGSLHNESSEEGRYTKEIIIEPINEFSKKILSKVTAHIDKEQTIILSEIIIDPTLVSVSDTCSLFLASNWKKPNQIQSITDPGFDTITQIDILNKKIFVATNSATVSKTDFHVIDIVSLDNPEIKSINTGPGLNDVAVAGDYAYVANSSINAELQVIDIKNPNNPLLISSLKLPTVTGGISNTIFYKDKKIYLGTAKTTGPEFNVIDVSVPSNPLWLGGFETNTLINDIFVLGNKAYVATATGKQMRVLDISDPGSIFETGDISLSQWLSQSGKSLDILGDTIYLGRTYGGGKGDHPELWIFNINSLDSPEGVQEIAASANDIFIRNKLAFLATNDENKEFQVWNIADPGSIVLRGFLNLDDTAVSLDCEGDAIYITTQNSIKVIEGEK